MIALVATAWQLVLNVTLLHALQAHGAGAWNYPSWSISAEWIAYCAFPLLSAAILRRGDGHAGRRLIPLGIVVLLVWAVAPLAFGTGLFDLHANFGWARILPEFAFGIALYAWGRRVQLAALASSMALLLLCAAIAVLAWYGMTLAMLAPLALLILAGAEMARSDGVRFLSLPPFIEAGEISYALYMIHLPVATVVLRGTRGAGGVTPLWALPLAAFLALIAAIACHRFVEKPGHRLIMRLSPNSRRQT
ncbi:acyltransferase [Sphingomonas sp. CD22]|uniref:acyltransferase family protein n=1 Tax=Sphingomonas sp. CD22 TaxID=3100214 RepID=UPI002AE087E7|nr:acyltransferase [Sphingomonas sp. CD22]MEA1084984.1 acyltransferase [Sphingomonas sp. CD22]